MVHVADESLRLVTAHDVPAVPFQETEASRCLPIAVYDAALRARTLLRSDTA